MHHPVKLNDKDLITNLDGLAGEERRCQVRGLVCLAEVDRRRLHLKLGYSGLFVFCAQRYKWSEGSIYRRIQIARKSRECPEILDAIRGQALSLTVASMLCPHLTRQNASGLIGEFKGMSRRDAEERLRRKGQPQARPRESVRSLGLHPVKGRSLPHPSSRARSGTSTSLVPTPGASPAPAPLQPPPQLEEQFSFHFAGRRQLRDKLERAKLVMAGSLDATSMEAVLEAALDCLLDKHDPKRKAARLAKRDAARQAKEGQCRPQTGVSKPEVARRGQVRVSSKTSVKRPHVPLHERRAVLRRAGHRCEWQADGRRCTRVSNLQLDHREARAKGGEDSISNYQVLCKAHNLLKARLEYGDAKIKQEIAQAARSGKANLPSQTPRRTFPVIH